MLVAAHYRAKGRLEKYKLALKAAGEKLSVVELTPLPAPEAFRASFELMQAANLVRPPWTNFLPVMTFIAPGKARVSWQQEVLSNSEASSLWPGSSREVATSQAALAEIRAVLRAPTLTFDLNYRQGASLLLPHLARLKGVAQWLSAATVVELHEGRATNAFEDLLALTTLAERYKGEPLMISELVRVSIAAIAGAASWEALQASDCTEAQLKALQTGWEGVDFLSQAEASLGMERGGGRKELR
ncbi:MAG TPA: hypothetical protein VN578_10765 [Candidatus Binatia bacterium]|jgi:hypothetical protein|nr:hypothetical protein [Candidatus Binatia bacterium]